MTKFRITQKGEKCFVQYQFLKRWFYIRSRNYIDYNMLTDPFNIIILLLPFVFFPFLYIDNDIIKIIFGTLFGLSAIMSILGIIILLNTLNEKIFFYTKKSAFYCIKNFEQIEIEKDLKKKKKIKNKKEKEKVIGIYLEGEYIDGKRLERWKKIDNILKNNNKQIKL
jgi:uncharacterized membrane protein